MASPANRSAMRAAEQAFRLAVGDGDRRLILLQFDGVVVLTVVAQGNAARFASKGLRLFEP